MIAEAGKSTEGRKRSVNSAKKYWWVAAILVPLVTALISKWPLNGGSPVPGTTYIANMTVIENQYQQFFGQPSVDPELKQKIQRAIDLGAKKDFRGAITLFEQIPENARVPAVWNDLGVAYAGLNDQQSARAAFERARGRSPDDAAASANLKHLDELKVTPLKPVETLVTDREIEPNNDIFHANRIPLNATIGAAIADDSDVDYFAFKTPPTYRDIIEIAIDNDSTTLNLDLHVFNADRTEIGSSYNASESGNLSYSFAAAPDSLYYVKVAHFTHTVGAYRLMVRPRKAYDAYEPNDDIFHASSIVVGKTIEAGIMDPHDLDFYQFKTDKAGNLVVSLENRSTSLQPEIRIHDANRTDIGGKGDGTPSANVSFMFAAQANSIYYVQVGPDGSSSGNYALTVRPE